MDYPDFITKTSVERQIDVHLNNPDNPGTFERTFRKIVDGQGINVSDWDQSFVVNDFTGDGIVDLAFADQVSGQPMKLVVMAGDGLGSFALHSESFAYDDTLFQGKGVQYYYPGDYDSADLNEDGHAEIVSFTTAGPRVHLGVGDGTFVTTDTYPFSGRQTRGRDSYLIDFDEDGHVDILETGAGNTTVNVRRGLGDGTFDAALRIGILGQTTQVSFGDLDNDGHLDFVHTVGESTNYNQDDAVIYAGKRDGLVDVLSIDLDGDGNEEVLAVNEANDRLKIFVGDNLGNLTRQTDLFTGRAPQAVAATDLNGDGVMELITANRASRSISVFVGDLSSGLVPTEYPVGSAPIDIASADLNGDGFADIVVLDESAQALWVYAGDGTLTLGTPVAISLGDAPGGFVLEDATGDGIIDAIVTLVDSNRLMILSSIGVQPVGTPIYVPLAGSPSDVAVVDLNDDGNPDLAATIPGTNALSILYPRGNLQFAKAQQIAVGANPTRLSLTDADQDGRIDLIVTNSGDHTASVICNRFDPNEVYRYDSDAIDPDDDTLTYDLVDGPGGMIINGQTGALLWAASPDQVGIHDVTISADDGRGGIATQSFKIDVQPARDNAIPLIATEPLLNIGAGETFSYQSTAVDQDRDALRYRLLDGPEGATIDPTNGLVQWDARTDFAMDMSPGKQSGEILVPADPSLKPASITVEGWYKLSSLPRFQVLMTDSGRNSVAYQVLVFETNQSLLVTFNFDDGGDRIQFHAPVSPVTDRWYHLALTYDAASGTGTLYVDGVAVGSGTTPNPQPLAFNPNAPTNIGQASGPTNATIDNYRIWNVARTPAEIREGMGRQYQDDPRMVLDYRFDRPYTHTVRDHSAAGNDGSLMGSRYPVLVPGLANAGSYPFTIGVEDGRGGFDQQSFIVQVLPELRGSISGHLFDDLDGDGQQSDGSTTPTEASLPGWELYVDTNGNAYPDPGERTAVTDANGNYHFDGLLSGVYPVRISPTAGYETPGGENITVTGNQASVFDLALAQLSLSHIRGRLSNKSGDAIAYWKVYADIDFVLEPNNTSVSGGLHFVTTPPESIESRQTYHYASVALGISPQPIAYDLSLAPDGMTIDPTTGLVVWRPTIDQVGKYRVILRATSLSGSVSLQDFSIDATAPDTLPVVTAMPSSVAYAGRSYTYDLVAQDAESTTLVHSLETAPDDATINASTGRLSWNPSAADVGSVDFSVLVTDQVGGVTRASWTVDVQVATPIVLPLELRLPRSSATVNQEYLSRIAGKDAIGRPVSWSLASGPAGLSVEADGTLRWTPTPSMLGQQTLELSATTADGNVESASFAISVTGRSVNSGPVIESTPITSTVLGAPYLYDLEVSDADSDIFAFTLVEGPAGMSIHPSRGTLRWTPAVDQLGETKVVIQVSDPIGATAVQAFELTTSRFGGPPRFVSIPRTEASVGASYLYTIGARDAEGDPLIYSLLTAPTGMTIVESTGEIAWTPTLVQVGTQDVVIQVADGVGGTATQAFSIRVADGIPNQPPSITSSSPRFGAVGSEFRYKLTATDPESTLITYSLGQGPAGMLVDATTGQVTWTPTLARIGKSVVTLIATDAGGAKAIESFELDVLSENRLPTIHGVAPLDVAAGAIFRSDVLARDADLDRLTFELTAAPAGATIDTFGRIAWPTSVSLIGSHEFTVRVTDPRGGEATQSFTLDVIEDLVPPKVSLIENLGEGNRNILPWQGPFKVFVRAIDNVEVASLTLEANGRPILLDAAGTATFTFEEWTFQEIHATATAIDTNGNVTTKTIVFDYDFPEGWSGAGINDIPTAIITSPSDAKSVTGMVSIVGTAAHDDFAAYKLSYRRVEETGFTEFLQSNSQVTNGELGVWDTSLLLNDEYVIRLEVATSGGVVNVVEHHVGLAGELKLGNFRLSFTDMVIPVAGIPIEITRIYDTLQADREGDFGYGWRLEYRNTDLRVGLPNSGLEDIGIYSALRAGVKVYLNVPGQGRQGFTFNPDIRVLPGFGGANLVLARPRFTPDPGVTSSLATGTSGYLQVNELGELYAPGGIPYNPASPDFGGAYVLTTRDGVRYRIDGATGKLLTASDRNQNTLLFSDAGIHSESSDAGIAIDRDRAGRITKITTSEGAATEYHYSGGDLVTAVDLVGEATRFVYDILHSHRLIDVIDPMGRTVNRSEYDANGRLESLVDLNGNKVRFVSDPQNRTQVVTDSLQNSELIEYDQHGSVVSRTDALGNATLYRYEGVGQLIETILPSGASIKNERDSSGRVIKKILPNGSVQNYQYGAEGVLVAEVDALGIRTTHQYDDRGNRLQSNRHGLAIRFQYDGFGNLISETDPRGGVMSIEYDSAGNAIKRTDRLGFLDEFTFDRFGRQLSSSTNFNDGGAEQQILVSHQYDGTGKRTSTTDVFGNSAEFSYNESGQLVSITGSGGLTYSMEGLDGPVPATLIAPDGLVTRSEFDALNRLTALTSAQGGTEVYRYDAVGNLIERILPDLTPGSLADNPRYQYEYDALGQMTMAIDPRGNAVTYEYDLSGNRIAETDSLGNTRLWRFDATGRLSLEIDQLGNETTYERDADGNLVRTRLPNGSTMEQAFDANGNLIAATDAMGNQHQFEYDANDQLVRVIDPRGGVSRYDYDSLGNLVSYVDARGNQTFYRYDGASRLREIINPLGQSMSFDYTDSSKISSRTEFDGTVTTYNYDSADRLQGVSYPESTTVYRYDAGRVAEIADANGISYFEYDTLNRLSAYIDANGTRVEYTYDTKGNAISISTNRGASEYTYDSLNRVTKSGDGTHWTMFEYDERGEVVRKVHSNGITERLTYDQLGNLSGSEISHQTSGLIQSTAYARDRFGNVVRKTSSDGSVSEFFFDSNNQLVREVRSINGTPVLDNGYILDAVGNRIQKTSLDGIVTNYVYNEFDQLTQETNSQMTRTFRYNLNGALDEVFIDGSLSAQYQYNDRRLLTKLTLHESGNTTIVEYIYDHHGNRIAKLQDGVRSNYTIDLNAATPRIIEKVAADNGLSTQYIYGGMVSMQVTDGAYRTFHVDHVGTPQLVTDESGSVVSAFARDAFGNLISQIGDENYLIGFSSGIQEDRSEPIHFAARNFDPSTGRFLSIDPQLGTSADPFSRHRYLYGRNNPTVFTDPSGQVTYTEVAVASALIGGFVALNFGALGYVRGKVFGTVDWEGISISGSFDPTGNLDTLLSGGWVDFSPSIGGQFNSMDTYNGPNVLDETGNYDGYVVGHSFTSTAGLSVGTGISAPASLTIGGFQVKAPRGMAPSWFPSAAIAFPYLLLDATASALGAGYTVESVLVMGFGVGDANGPSENVVASLISLGIPILFNAGFNVTAGISIPLYDSNLFGGRVPFWATQLGGGR